MTSDRTYHDKLSPNEHFEYGYPNSNALLTFSLQKDSGNLVCCAIQSAAFSCIKPLVSQ